LIGPQLQECSLFALEFWLLIFFQNLLRINFLPKHIGQSKRISLRSFLSARNLFPVNKKTTATNGGSFAGIQSYQLFVPMVTGFHGAQIPKLSFQCSRTQAFTSRTL
jgi:hypothetical protein